MTSKIPIEISPEDIVARPANVAGKTTGTPNTISSIKAVLKEAKAIKELAEDLGLDVKGLISKLQGGGETDARSEAPNPVKDKALIATQATEQIKLIITKIAGEYGDFTLNELVAQLKKEHGNRKLRDILK